MTCLSSVRRKSFWESNMVDAANEMTAPRSIDVVLQEMWRIKDQLSAARGHDVHRLFAEARERQKRSGHKVVDLSRTSGRKTLRP